MKKCYAFFIAMALAVNVFADSVCTDHDGNLRCSVGAIDSIDYTGDVFIDGTSILEQLKTVGELHAKNVNFNNINIIGDSDISNSTISGHSQFIGDFQGKSVKFGEATKIVGDLNCDDCQFNAAMTLVGDLQTNNSTFEGLVSLSTYTSHFKHSTLNELIVKKQSRDVDQIIYLDEGSSVMNITFDSNRGIVELSGGSVLKGKVSGGKVVNK